MFEFAYAGIAAGPAPLGGAVASGGSLSESGANGLQSFAGSSSVTAQGGVAPYTYSWSRVSGDTQIVATTSTSATTGWESTGTDQVRSASYKCTITDAFGATVVVTGFSISFTHGTPP